MSSHLLDTRALYRQLDTRRMNLDMSWRAVGRACGLNSSTFTRLSKGQAPDAHNLVTMLTWLGIGDELDAVVKPLETP